MQKPDILQLNQVYSQVNDIDLLLADNQSYMMGLNLKKYVFKNFERLILLLHLHPADYWRIPVSGRSAAR